MSATMRQAENDSRNNSSNVTPRAKSGRQPAINPCVASMNPIDKIEANVAVTSAKSADMVPCVARYSVIIRINTSAKRLNSMIAFPLVISGAA